jgi:hypothetical protein
MRAMLASGLESPSPAHRVVNPLALVLQVLLDIRYVELKRENQAVQDGQRVWEGWIWPGTASCFDRLALVSKASMDTRFLELRRENERLKLELFWKTYNIDMLHHELCQTHSTMNFFACDCESCILNGRLCFYFDEEGDEFGEHFWTGFSTCTSCLFKEWFERFIYDDVDMDVCYDGNDDGYFWFDGADDDDAVWSWGYGSKLVQAPSVSSPHLRKLEWAFQMLYSMRNPS